MNSSSLKDSKIINTDDLKRELMQVCGFDPIRKLELLYRGRETNFSWENFHAKCDNKSPTLVIVQSNDGCIFGGYTRAEWNPPMYECLKADSEAYLFRLKTDNLESKKYKIVDHEQALFCLPSIGPCFGFSDLLFNSDGVLLTTLHSNIPDTTIESTFGVPFKLQVFQVKTEINEIEVYQEF